MQVTESRIGLTLQQPNAGQVARLKLLPIERVLAILSPDELPVVGSPKTISKNGLNVEAGSILTELVFPAGGCTMQETSQADPAGAGTSWELTLEAALPRNQPALTDWLETNQARRWLAIWLDRNGQAYLAGEPGNGLRLELSRTIGALNYVQVTIKGRSWHPAWFLETFDSASLFADVDFDLSFDISFNA
ncbi:hypothetical protein GO755_35005 [Spirosoma sp. HMF4905]|uniref:Uncharacterized protein n=1 Tax=Spirosoma arboris TaxID=2682092 RepID=A0A7K1SNA8_9BACT|nr:hypothetical protein [Spirosoma arboris]MVM35284.1 hypothetical protein [Spirosoma arboris]